MNVERLRGESGNSALRLLVVLFIAAALSGRCSAVDVGEPGWPEADCPPDQDEVVVDIPEDGYYLQALRSVFGPQISMDDLGREGVESGIGSTPDEVLNNARALPPGNITICQ